MKTVQIMAGTLYANVDERIVSGLLLPFGEKGRTNLGEFTVEAGAFTLPEDIPGTMGVNIDHDRERPVGRTLTAHETPAGIYGSVAIAKGAEGDVLLAGYAAKDPNVRSKLSVEVKNVVVENGRAKSGDVFGLAIVDKGAWPSAGVLLASLSEDVVDEDGDTLGDRLGVEDGDPADGDPVTTENVVEETTVDELGNSTTTTTTTSTSTEADGTTTTTTTVVEVTTPAEIEPATPVESDPLMATAKAPLVARKPAAPKPLDFAGFARMLGAHKAKGGGSLYAAIAEHERKTGVSAATLFAALNDVKFDSAAADPDVAGDAINGLPQWLGELWSGRAYQRRVIPLLGSAPMTSLKIAGWRWKVKPTVAPWAGNKAAVPSNVPETESYDVFGRRLAGAHDIAREYRDFSVPEFWDGYFRGMNESYAMQSDDGTLDDLVEAATLIQRGTVPAGVSPAMTQIVDGALQIIDEGIPSFAVVSKDLYRDILLTRNDDTLAYLNAALGLEEGTIDTFKVIPHKNMIAGTALVGAKEAATSYELPGVPIRVEAENVAQGGIDTGLFGYYGTVIHDAAAIALVADDTATFDEIELDRAGE